MGTSAARLLASLAPWLWRFGLVAALCATSAKFWVPDTLLALVAATLALYAGLMVPFALREPLGTYVRPRLEALRRLVLRDLARGDGDR
jgi:hypothetical protein